MQLGTIKGKVDTSTFKFRATEEVRKFDFVSVKSNDKWILAQVEEVTKHPDGKTEAKANIIGYRDKGLTKAPRRVIEPDSIVYQADQELISDTLGLREEGLQIGTLETNEVIDIYIDGQDFYKHYSVLAQTGAGKSYLNGVIIEELLEADYPLLILDPHGEYSSLKNPNPENEDDPKGYGVKEYSPNTDINTEAHPLKFSSKNLEKKELKKLIPDSLTNSQMGVLYNALKKLDGKEEDYNLLDIQDAVSQEESKAKWRVLDYLEQLEDSGLYSENPVNLEELIEPGRATIINLKAVEPDNAEMTAYLLAKKLFDLRKKNLVPPFLMIMEEAHNYVPEKGFGQAVSNPIMRKIASEGRKFGLGLGVISQRPARIDKNVLSQCNTQFILRVTNPNDLKAISKSFEGMTSEIENMIKSLPPGVAFALGNEHPVMTNVRQRRSQHGGETQTNEEYVKKSSIESFKVEKTLQDYNNEMDEKYSPAYYPLYVVEKEDKRLLVDAVKNQIKSEKYTVTGQKDKVLSMIKQGMNKGDIMDETGLSMTKLTNIVEDLRSKGVLASDSLKVEESIFDIGFEDATVDEEDLIDVEVEEEEIESNYGQVDRLVYYPYYSAGENVYDPVLGKEI